MNQKVPIYWTEGDLPAGVEMVNGAAVRIHLFRFIGSLFFTIRFGSIQGQIKPPPFPPTPPPHTHKHPCLTPLTPAGLKFISLCKYYSYFNPIRSN